MPSKRQHQKAKKRYTDYFLREKLINRKLTYHEYLSYFEEIKFETDHQKWVHHRVFTNLLDKYMNDRF